VTTARSGGPEESLGPLIGDHIQGSTAYKKKKKVEASDPTNDGEITEELVRRLREEIASLQATCDEQSRYIDDLSEENGDIVRKYELAVDQFVAAAGA
jgi:predicted RNase H-like nuclease (RuvC/YqgF family)